ncbi:hypothetical protein AgCh_007759 [Apium graveolens]
MERGSYNTEAEVGNLDAEKEEARAAVKAIKYNAANKEYEKIRNHLLQVSLFVESDDAISTQKAIANSSYKKKNQSDNPAKGLSTVRKRIHGSFLVSLAATLDILG